MNRLPVVNHRAWIFTDQIVADFESTSRAGLGVVLQHFSPTGDSGIGGDLHEDPGVFQDEGLELRDLDIVFGGNGSGFYDGARRI